MNKIEISPQFEQVLNFVNQTDKTIFLTGKAGTGKTTLLKYIRENTHKQMAVCAPTGVAAINAGGSTIHSFFQFPFTPFVPRLKENGDIDPSGANLPALKYNSRRLSVFRSLELLVIDEISMVRADLLDQIDITLRHTRRKWHLPFGGVQVLLIGDMHQLPPVVQGAEWELLRQHYMSPYFFESYVIRTNKLVYIELEKIYRQSEEKFIRLLNKVRNNELDHAALEELNSHYRSGLSQADYANGITLTTHNRKADEINNRNLEALPGKPFKFTAEISGIFPDKNYPADEELLLKTGTRVMFLKNNTEKNYYNGKIGIISHVDGETIQVKCEEDNAVIEVEKETWTNVAYKINKATKHVEEDILGTYIQFPLRHAWAITIHKSQGLTFDKLIIDAADSFSSGQVYVALSRCRSLKGLTLSSRIVSRSLMNDENILKFASARPESAEIDSIFHSARHGYLKSILLSLFDFTEQSEHRKDLAGLQQMYGNRLDENGKTWMGNLFVQFDALNDVALKFRNQLQSLCEAADDIERDEKLKQRISQASVYFSKEIRKCTDLLRKCELRTESREAADELNEPLQLLFDTLYAKNELITSCAGGFVFADYVRTRLKIVYPGIRMNVYATAANSRVRSDIKHPLLFRELLLLRDEICNEEGKPIYLVANSKTLSELCLYLPETTEQLLSISGFGKAKAEVFGERFLSLIRAYKSEHQLVSELEFKPRKERKKKAKAVKGLPVNEKVSATGTRDITLELFRKGKSPEEIAEARGFTLGTILSHFVPFVKSGDIQLSELVPEAKQEVILNALADFTAESGIGPVKARLPEDISYSDIRLVLAGRES